MQTSLEEKYMSSLLDNVKSFAKKAHNGQFDKGGHPYYLHLQNVASMGKTEEEKIVGYLHDVIEDTNYTIEDIRLLGINDNCIEAIKYLTHDKNISYDEYIKNIKSFELARKVKINDLKNNLDLSRIDNITDNDIKRNKKYQKYLEYLEK